MELVRYQSAQAAGSSGGAAGGSSGGAAGVSEGAKQLDNEFLTMEPDITVGPSPAPVLPTCPLSLWEILEFTR